MDNTLKEINLKDLENEYTKQNRAYLSDMLDHYFAGPVIDAPSSAKEYHESCFPNGVELIIRPQCNMKCEYCYIHQHGSELYPVEERIGNEEILNNINMILEYFYKVKGYAINKWDLFAGDLFYDNLIFDILDVMYPYLAELWDQYRNKLIEENSEIMLPCNCKELIKNPEKRARWMEYVKKFDRIGCRLIISWSTDGKYVAKDVREHSEEEDSYWEEGFDFAAEMGYGIHPMLSYESLDSGMAKKNYDWLKSMIQSRPKMWDQQVPYLVVRNDGWTDKRIEAYLDFLAYCIKDRFAQCHNNVEEFAYHLFVGDGKNGTLPRVQCFDPIGLETSNDPGTVHGDSLTCGIQRELYINVQNLAIVPCHRLAYKQFIAGHFDVEDNRITGITPKNVTTWASVFHTKNSVLPKCALCPYNRLCMKGCLGSQYEYSGELLYPIPNVCKMQQNVISFLCKVYCEMGVIREAYKFKDLNLLTRKTLEGVIDFCDWKEYDYGVLD